MWDARVDAHVTSKFYDLNSFIEGKSSLKPIEIGLLGDVNDAKILHLQCHFGQDTISLARLGAVVLGIDFSTKAIAKANDLARITKTTAKFVCCDVYSLPDVVNDTFDIVFASYGTIGWLPDLEKWSQVVFHCLRPGGRLIFVEFHPVVWMFDAEFSAIKYDYFNTGPIVEEMKGTYADREADIRHQSIVDLTIN
jgi:SAM-dependent methyltransferase